jgi:hypothetical protein
MNTSWGWRSRIYTSMSRHKRFFGLMLGKDRLLPAAQRQLEAD